MKTLRAVAVMGAAWICAPALADACLNDFEIRTAERELAGAYATPTTPSESPLDPDILIAVAGGIAFGAAMLRAGRAA